MSEHREIELEIETGTHQAVSMNMEGKVTSDVQVERVDKFSENINKHGSTCMRFFFIVILCIIIFIGAGGTTIYYTVLSIEDQLLASADANSTFPVKNEVSGLTITRPNKENICPTNWTYHDRKCYRYSSIPVHFSDAEEYCAGLGGTALENNVTGSENIPETMRVEMIRFIACCFQHHVRSNSISGKDYNDNGVLPAELTSTNSMLHTSNSTKTGEYGKHAVEVTSKDPTSDLRFWLGTGHQHNHDSEAESFDDNTYPSIEGKRTDHVVTSTAEFPGFWLGAGHQHHHDSEAESFDDKTYPSIEGKRTDHVVISTTRSPENQNENRDKDLNIISLKLKCGRFDTRNFQWWDEVACEKDFFQVCVRNL